MLIAVEARDQELVLFYAVAVFLSCLVGLLAMAHFSYVERRPPSLLVNVLGAGVVCFTLVLNLPHLYPLLSLGAATGIAAALYLLWGRAGRPRGIASAAQEAEAFGGMEGGGHAKVSETGGDS